MHFGLLHMVFDLVMAVVLLRWLGRRLVALSRHDLIGVAWECLLAELRKARPQTTEAEATAKLRTAADVT